MSYLSHALKLASLGFHVFPLVPNSKTPLIDDFPHMASRDPERIKSWWVDPVLELEQPFNIGISTSRFKDSEHLVVIDVDNKEGKKGDEELLEIELKGNEVPETFEQKTPTGGRHLVYRTQRSLKQGTRVFGDGLDVRARGGYIVGTGSSLADGVYSTIRTNINDAPEWLVSRLSYSDQQKRSNKNEQGRTSNKVERVRARDRAQAYLRKHAPLAVEGEAGDQTTFKVAAKLKDIGVDEDDCLELMRDEWNDRCTPPWDLSALESKVTNAYQYGLNEVGADAPENQFEPVTPEPKKEEGSTREKPLHPFDKLNEKYAYVLINGRDHILFETTDHKGKFKLDHIDIEAFHRDLSAFTMNYNGKAHPVSKLWISSGRRRSYRGICFAPGREVPEEFYNLWRGFAVEPLGENEQCTDDMQLALDAFLDHAKTNICQGDEKLYAWLITYFAHVVQKPWELPLVALVFKGKKGTGKNAVIERVGYLLGKSFSTVSNRRYLTGNFNSILENKLILVLDEAFWSGDKAAEGILKTLITGNEHTIERKGKEPYEVDNCLRVVILGNEDWIVPASEDERRFAVFNVGEGRKQDRKFFREMRERMEGGGYRLLLKFLMEWDLSQADVFEAPNTVGLTDQKLQSLRPFYRFWRDCLESGKIICADFGNEWPLLLDKERLRIAFTRYLREQNIGGWVPSESAIGKALKDCIPKLETVRPTIEGVRIWQYKVPPLTQARELFEKYIGGKFEWQNEIELEEKDIYS